MAHRPNALGFKKKLKNKSGFTLAETLLAVLILLLVSVIVANGMPVVRNVYNNVIVGANAQMLLSTTVTALRNELGTARDIRQLDDGSIVYFKTGIGAYAKLSVDANEGILLLDYVNKDDGTAIPMPEGTDPREARRLVSDAASNKNLRVSYGNSVAIDSDIVTLSTLEVRLGTGSNPIASLDKLSIRTFNLSDA